MVPMRVLVVEDDPILALTAVLTLESAGYDVAGPAYDCAQALGFAGASRPDFVLMDINLAGCDEGLYLARDLWVLHGIPSLFVSGQLSTARANKGDALGLLRKPYEPQELVDAAAVVQAVLAGSAVPPPRVPGAMELFDGPTQI